mmetsp:Transcript_19595/g.57745  ORF Transcript_19595/g.57745 Transcript_19595/m.57745 type:complete len:311 (+) Transcript_19595:242-1174(+)
MTESSAWRSSGLAHRACAASNEAKDAATSERVAPAGASVDAARDALKEIAREGCRADGSAKGSTVMRSSGAPILRKVKSSMTHQSRLLYVGPAMTSSVSQPARKMGRHASDSRILHWSMHSLSSQTFGERPCLSRKAAAQPQSASHFAPGGSCQLWLMNASHWPRPRCSLRSSSAAPPQVVERAERGVCRRCDVSSEPRLRDLVEPRLTEWALARRDSGTKSSGRSWSKGTVWKWPSAKLRSSSTSTRFVPERKLNRPARRAASRSSRVEPSRESVDSAHARGRSPSMSAAATPVVPTATSGTKKSELTK